MHNLALADACLVLFEILACGDTCLQQHFGLFLSAKKKKKKKFFVAFRSKIACKRRPGCALGSQRLHFQAGLLRSSCSGLCHPVPLGVKCPPEKARVKMERARVTRGQERRTCSRSSP